MIKSNLSFYYKLNYFSEQLLPLPCMKWFMTRVKFIHLIRVTCKMNHSWTTFQLTVQYNVPCISGCVFDSANAAYKRDFRFSIITRINSERTRVYTESSPSCAKVIWTGSSVKYAIESRVGKQQEEERQSFPHPHYVPGLGRQGGTV